MINLSLQKQLGIIAPNTNRALAVVLKEASAKELETILKAKDLRSVMNSLLKESAQSFEADKTLLHLLKNNPTLKDLGNVTNTLKELLNALKGEKTTLPLETALKKSLIGIKELSEPLLKEKIQNSGVFLEAKLKDLQNLQKPAVQESMKEIMSKDLKAILLQAGDELSRSSYPNQAEISKYVDKLLLQIDYYQLLSHLSNSSSLYLPFSWESLEEGNINIKKDKNGVFYCDIDLKLKEYGELKLKLALYEEDQINIYIYTESIAFKEIVKENIASLRLALIEAQITPREIRIFDSSKKNPTSVYEAHGREIDMGFEAKA